MFNHLLLEQQVATPSPKPKARSRLNLLAKQLSVNIDHGFKRQDNIVQYKKTFREQQNYMQKVNELVKLTKKNKKIFNCRHQSLNTFIKASNLLLEPFSELDRGKDTKAEKQLKIPPNSLPQTERIVAKKELTSLTDFCKKRNIPFNENEKRFYLKEKSKLQYQKYEKAMHEFFNGIMKRQKLRFNDRVDISPSHPQVRFM